jgi:hypothetical protein
MAIDPLAHLMTVPASTAGLTQWRRGPVRSHEQLRVRHPTGSTHGNGGALTTGASGRKYRPGDSSTSGRSGFPSPFMTMSARQPFKHDKNTRLLGPLLGLHNPIEVTAISADQINEPVLHIHQKKRLRRHFMAAPASTGRATPVI